MWSTEYRFPLALVLTSMCAGSAAGVASENQFEGPYKITITASKKIRATVKSVYRYPNMVAQEWWVAYPLPPEFDGQPAARGRIRIMEAPLAEPGRISRRERAAAAAGDVALVPRQRSTAAQSFTVEATYDVTINRRTPGARRAGGARPSTDAGRAIRVPGAFEPLRLHEPEISGLARASRT